VSTQGPFLAATSILSPSARLDRLGPAREVAQIGAVIGRGFSHALIRAVAGIEDASLQAALERLAEADILLAQGVPPEADYRFKHALIQDAAYENLLKSRRQVLHRRIAEALRDKFADSDAAEPELLAHHFTQAGLSEAAIEWWGKAAQRSLERSALVEAVGQFTRALHQIARLPATPSLRREQIKLQIAVIGPLYHTKGPAAPETRAAAEQALLLIEGAEALGERPDDPLALFSVLYGIWAANSMAFNGDVLCELSAEFLALAKKQRATAPLMIGHRLMGTSCSLAATWRMAARTTIRRSRYSIQLSTMRSQRVLLRTSALRFCHIGPLASWMLGYPEASRTDAEQVLKDARAIRLFPTLMYALYHVAWVLNLYGNYKTVSTLLDELRALSEQKGALFWKMTEAVVRGHLLTLIGKASDAIPILTSALAQAESTGTTVNGPTIRSYLARAYADTGQLDDAWRYINEAMTAIEATKERWWESEVHRIAGEIALVSSEQDASKAEAYFERALAVARKQQAKSWELRAAMSMARLWRDQGKRDEARELLAPVYGWFTEGFDTLDLKEAKSLLDELAS
jgi:hypothetical protein